MTKKWLAEAPSNIALIKYMGRKHEENKIPANASLSYTLPHLKSFVELELLENGENSSYWEPLILPNSSPISLSASGQERFIAHLNKILRVFFQNDTLVPFIIRSCNNFPLGVGLASSASSFAALTLAAVKAAASIAHQPELPINEVISLSRQGSGSSCRSFYTPWVLWKEEEVIPLHYPEYDHLIHQVVLLETQEKHVSSSLAHRRVQTSPFYEGRTTRAENRLALFKKALANKQWNDLYHIAWDEFQDMHQLFETAIPSFSYHNEYSQALLKKLEHYWKKKGDGPLITMDAGPNIHLLYRADQQDIQQEIQHQLLSEFPYVLST